VRTSAVRADCNLNWRTFCIACVSKSSCTPQISSKTITLHQGKLFFTDQRDPIHAAAHTEHSVETHQLTNWNHNKQLLEELAAPIPKSLSPYTTIVTLRSTTTLIQTYNHSVTQILFQKGVPSYPDPETTS
jgi:hypothetical protein